MKEYRVYLDSETQDLTVVHADAYSLDHNNVLHFFTTEDRGGLNTFLETVATFQEKAWAWFQKI